MSNVAQVQHRLVVSLATIPSRIGKLRPVIDSLKAQTRKPDRIYVCICEYCEWEQGRYEVPAWLAADPAVRIVVSPRDYGPANKLLGVLGEEAEPSTRIVVVDDDWQCHSGLLEELEHRFRPERRTAIGLSGARLPRRWSQIEVRIGAQIESDPPLPWRLTFLAETAEDLAVDVLQFGFGALVLRGWFADDIYALADPRAPWFFADDMLFSAYLEQRGIARVCAAGLPLPRLLDHAQLKPLAGNGRMTQRYREAIPALATRFRIWQPGELAAAFPSRPTPAELRYWAKLAVRKGKRLAHRAVTHLFRSRGN